MTLRSSKLALECVSLAAIVAISGCASKSSVKAKVLKSGPDEPALSLADCANITIMPFSVPDSGKVDAAVGVTFAQGIDTRLSSDFGPLFDSVEYAAAARGVEKECLINGAITKYKPGSRVARAILIGLGSASLEGSVTVSDAASGSALLDAPFDKLWAWGGIIGASKGMGDMVAEASASVAATVAHGRGWTAPPK